MVVRVLGERLVLLGSLGVAAGWRPSRLSCSCVEGMIASTVLMWSHVTMVTQRRSPQHLGLRTVQTRASSEQERLKVQHSAPAWCSAAGMPMQKYAPVSVWQQHPLPGMKRYKCCASISLNIAHYIPLYELVLAHWHICGCARHGPLGSPGVAGSEAKGAASNASR